MLAKGLGCFELMLSRRLNQEIQGKDVLSAARHASNAPSTKPKSHASPLAEESPNDLSEFLNAIYGLC